MAFQIDTSHSEIMFSARHMMVSKVRGVFEKWSGIVDLNLDDPGKTAVDIQIEADSISTKDEQRDAHLRSADFLNAEVYPRLHFMSTEVQVLGENRARLYGDLTIRDITRPVVLNVEYQGNAQSPWGQTSYGFSAHTKINREDWDLNWNAALETGGWLVGKEIQIDIELELIRVEEAQPVAA